MTLTTTTEKITKLAATKPALGRSVLFATDEGNIFINEKNEVSNIAGDADCTITVDMDDLNDLIIGETSAMSAFMFGKLKISGDMTVAMKLKDLF